MRDDPERLPAGWIATDLGSAATITLGGTPSTEVSRFWGGEIPWMSSGEVHQRRIEAVDGRITEAGLASSNATLVDPPSVAVALAGQGKTRGAAALVGIRLCTNQSVALVKGRNGSLDASFLFYELDRRYEELRARSSGGGRAGLSRRVLAQVPLRIPPIVEQHRIAEILDSADEAILGTEHLIAKLERVKQGVLHDLLTRGIDANGEPISPVRLKDSPLGRIRADWDVAPLRAYGSVDRPYLKTGPFGSSLKQAHWRATGVPVITIGCLGEGVITQSELLHVSEPTARSLAAYAVVPGDIVFSRVADVGRSAVVRESERGWIISSNLMWLSVDRRRAVPEFLQANLAGNTGVRRQIRKLVNSAGRDVANAATMNAVLFPWPPFDEQVRIAGVLRATDSRIDWERTVLLKLSLLKQGLMEDLLTGRVRVSGLLEGDAA